MEREDFQMTSAQITDINSTLEYGHSHRLARQVFIGSLFGIALGLVLLISIDGREIEGKHQFFGGIILAGSLVLIGVAILSAHAAEQTEHCDFPPWRTLPRHITGHNSRGANRRASGYDRVSHGRDLTSTKVVKLDVSPAFYNKYSRGRWLDFVTGMSGDPERNLYFLSSCVACR